MKKQDTCFPFLKRISGKIKWYFNRELSDKNIKKGIELRQNFESMKYWTPELIDWIAKTEDSEKLSITSCLVNCHKWPDWLPSKPEWHDDMNKNREDETFRAKLHFCMEIYRMCKEKAELISPGLYEKIWLTHSFKKHSKNLTYRI